MMQVMKLLTIISTIFIPLTFIVGVFGMNFDLMPLVKAPLGFWLALAMMATRPTAAIRASTRSSKAGSIRIVAQLPPGVCQNTTTVPSRSVSCHPS